MRLLFTAILLFYSFITSAQDSLKTCRAVRMNKEPKIDGVIDPQWNQINPVSDFVMNRPIEGGKPTQKSEVRVGYTDYAVYVLGVLHDSSPDSILHELGNRDDGNLNADFFRFVIDPYNLRQDAYDFGVYASGVQADAKFSDFTFNAVWSSAVKITDQGWIVEMEIPYSAIRFPKKDVQEWAMQTTRYIRRNREFDQWCLTPSTAANAEVYWGTLEGISKIETPVRLSLTPYVSAYLERSPDYTDAVHYNYSNTFSYNVGADVKYGIDDRFTLDMTLFPDFGQVQSDNKVKNLGYQEVIYNENRSFFKEGTDLFSKYNLFYSRRIGKTPTGFYDVPYMLGDNEKIVENPSKVKLLNAVKVSGRTNSGTGLGIFNAVTDNMYATIEDGSGNRRKILTEPLTNYNIFVIDQQLNDYSNVNFINTNVIRTKGESDANVSFFGYTLADKKNTFATDGYFGLSQTFNKDLTKENSFEDVPGYKYFVGVRKINGIYQYGISRTLVSRDYNQYDLGYYTTTNYVNHHGYVTFNWFKPWKSFRDGNVSITLNQSHNLTTGKLGNVQGNLDFYSTLMSYNSIYGGFGIDPFHCYDYYEPRVAGRYNKTIRFWFSYFGISSDYRKPLAVDLTLNVSNFIGRFVSEGYNYNLLVRYRFSDHLTISVSNNFNFDPYNFGVADYSDPQNIIYGLRILHTYENILSGKYIFKNDMSLTLNARHYWTTGKYRLYYTLLDDGQIQANDTYGLTNNNDFNYNVFNIDLVYSWQFAPGSNLSVVYKNYIEDQISTVTKNVFDNFSRVIDLPQTNSVSVKLIYYLDYQKMKIGKKM